MSVISVNQLTFYYEGSYDNIFEDVSFQLDTDWKLGFVARNGRGKTTFLKLLMGEYEYRGSISSSEKFDYFPFPVKDYSKETMEVIEELYPDNEFWKICRELTLMRVDADVLYRPFGTLSQGERTKVMLAVLFSMDHSFLLIDEPTNHLDAAARELVKEYLRGKKGFLLVSHDRDFMDGCIDHVLVINKTGIEVFQGTFTSWWENKQRRDEFEKNENIRLKKDIRRLEESARQKQRWAEQLEKSKIGSKTPRQGNTKGLRPYIGEKSRRMQVRRKNLEHRQQNEIEEKSKLLRDVEEAEDLKLFPLRHHRQKLVEFEDVRIFYENADGESGRKYLRTLDFVIENGDCAVLSGRNGCGKTSVIKAILREAGMADEGDFPGMSHSGLIRTASGLLISCVSQDTGFLSGNVMDYAVDQNLDLTIFLGLLRKLDFSRLQFEKSMEEYSEGQKKKVLLAESLCTRAHLYIWDEPLNFIDVFSRIQLEELLLSCRPTLLLVEHDRSFVDKLATKIICCE